MTTTCLLQPKRDTLRDEILPFIERHPVFFLSTAFAKLGAFLPDLLLFSPLGVLAAAKYAKPRRPEWTLHIGLNQAVEVRLGTPPQ